MEKDSKEPETVNKDKSLTSAEDLEVQKVEDNQKDKSKAQGFGKKLQGLQAGDSGMWRTTPLVPNITIPHYPEHCAACNAQLAFVSGSKPYMGYYVLELEKNVSGFGVKSQLHHYYEATCECGHQTKTMPGLGYVSVVEGRSKNLQLQEYGLVGPMLATFIASLAVRAPDVPTLDSRILTRLGGRGTEHRHLDRCIREAGIACVPVVKQLLSELQTAEVIHLDETPWYEKGKFCWLWVAFSHHHCGVSHWQSQKGRTAASNY